LIRVDLPAPLRPTRPKTSPAATDMSTESTATMLPKRQVSASVSIRGEGWSMRCGQR
jgi:hypothetical protein